MGQVKITEAKTEGFKPFTLEITIESTEEAWNLWHRMNVSTVSIISELYNGDGYAKELISCGIDTIVWDTLDNEMIKQKLKD